MEEKAVYKVSVYNTFTKSFEIVEVKENIFNTYRRSEWNINKSDKKYFRHETVMSSLKGGENNAFENFKEFTDTNPEHIPETVTENNEVLGELKKALNFLSEEEQELIKAVFYDCKSLRKYAEEKGISHTAVSKRKRAILRKLRTLLS